MAVFRKLALAGAIVSVLAVAGATSVFATVSPNTGQPGAPNNTCGDSNPVMPGNSANSPGSVFNSSGTSTLHYAGNPNTASLANSNSTAAVSQYDSACVQLSH